MLTNTINGENRQTYYTTSSQIGNNTGCVFLDSFTKKLSETDNDNSSNTVSSAQSMLSIEIYTENGSTLAFSLNSNNFINDSADPRADKYFDDPENVKSAIQAEYTKLKEAGFTTAEISDSEITEMANIFSRISSFSQYNNQDYYGENNSGRYQLESGLVVDVMHQEIVTSEDYDTEKAGITPVNWTADNAISDLPGFEEFKNFGFSKIIDLPQDSTVDDDTSNNDDNVDDTSGSDQTDDTDNSQNAGDGDNSDNSESPYHIEDDAIIKALFNILTESTEGIGYGSAAEQDFKDLIIDFNNEINDKESLTAKKEYFDSTMPYISELTSLLEEPATVESIFKSINVIFDAAFTDENYSIRDTGDAAINSELFSLRGTIDTYLNKISNLKDEMDEYNEENPLDAGSTEVDPVWEAKLEKMHNLINEFFGNYGPQEVNSFIESKLETQDENDNEEEIGPEEGIQGSLYDIIRKNPNGIPLDSLVQEDVRIVITQFEKTIYEMKTSGYSTDKIKEEFDSAMPYINKALELLNDTDAVLYNINKINTTFKTTFLNHNGSVPETYEEDLYQEILQERGKLNQAIKSFEYYNNRLKSGMQNNEPQALLDNYNNSLDTALENFISATNVKSYTAALNQYRQENSSEES